MIRGSDSWTVCYAPNTRTLDVPNMALLAHFYNHGPELVETLKRLLNNTPDAGFVKTTPQFLTAYTSALDQARAVLSEASTVQMP